MSGRTVCLVLAVAAVSGCSASGTTAPRVCTLNLVPAIVLSVRDAGTHVAVAAGAVVTADVHDRRGARSITAVGTDTLFIPVGTASGSYDLVLKKSGYSDFTRSAVVVPAADPADCHPATVSIAVALQPNP